MKRQLLTLSIVTALTACGSDDNILNPAEAPSISGDLSGVATKAADASGTMKVFDLNPGESLVYPDSFDGTYGNFEINAAGEWEYTLYTGSAEHPDITALVKAGLPDLKESFTVKTADLTQQVITLTIRGIDVPATFKGDIANRIVQRDTGKGSVDGVVTVSDANPEEAFFAELEAPIATLYGTTTFDYSTGAWTYDLDEENEAVIALAPDESLDDVFTIKSLDGTEQVVTVLVLGSEPIPASFEPFSNLTIIDVDSFSAVFSVDAESFTSSIAVQDPNYQEAAMKAENGISTTYGSVTVDENGIWTYNIDYTKDGISDLYFSGANDAPPSASDSFFLTSVDGTQALVSVTLQGAELVPAIISGFPTLDDDGVSSSAVNMNVTSVSGKLLIDDSNFGQSSFMPETIDALYGALTISEGGDWVYALSNESVTAIKNNSLALPINEEVSVSSFDGTTEMINVSIVALEPGNFGVRVGDNNGKDGKWVIDMPESTSTKGKATFTMRFPEDSAKDVKVVFHGRKYKPTELHRVLLALTVRANGELRLNNSTGNGKTFTLNDTVVKGQPVPVEFTWDASAGRMAILSLKINDTFISADDISINEDGTFESLATPAATGLQNLGPLFFEVQTKGGNTFDIDDFKVYEFDGGYTELLNEKFDGDDVFEGSTVSLDYQSSSTSSNSTSTGVVFPTNLAVKTGDNNGKDGKWVIDMPATASTSGKATFTMLFPGDSAKDVKVVFHGRKYKPTELHRVLLALTVRANGELRLNNSTGNGKTFTLNDTVVKGQPVPVEFTWDASAGRMAILSLKINDTFISADDISINADGTFESLATPAATGLQNLGPLFFEVQTKGGNSFIINDFKVYSDVNGWVNILSDNFNDQTENTSVSLDYQSSSTSGNSTTIAVDIENLED